MRFRAQGAHRPLRPGPPSPQYIHDPEVVVGDLDTASILHADLVIQSDDFADLLSSDLRQFVLAPVANSRIHDQDKTQLFCGPLDRI